MSNLSQYFRNIPYVTIVPRLGSIRVPRDDPL